MEQLKEALNNFKKGHYKPKSYSTEEEIEAACSKEKIFWFKGNAKTIKIVYCPIFIGIFLLLALFNILLNIQDITIFLQCLFSALAFFSLAGLIIFLRLRAFIVVGSQGMIYRKWFITNYLKREDLAKAGMGEVPGGFLTMSITMYYLIYTKDQQVIRLNLSNYISKNQK